MPCQPYGPIDNRDPQNAIAKSDVDSRNR
jgi:hypothetical protein